MSPLVSVVLPVRDGEQFLRAAVESALAQTLADIELIAVDDGSTDSSADILREYARADGRVVIMHTHGVGQADARNGAVAVARSGLIAFLDHDDVACSDRLERQCAFLAEHADVALVGGALTFIDDTGHAFAKDVRYPVSDAEIRSAFTHTTPILNSAATIRKEAFAEVGGYRRLYADSEDLDLWLRVADRHQLANIEATVVGYRIHGGQATARRMERQSMTSLAARMSARARAAGHPDPFEGVAAVDRAKLLELGATEDEITASFVVPATWMAKTLYRAGDAVAAEELLDAAEARARQSHSTIALAEVDRARALVPRPTVLRRLRRRMPGLH